MKPREPREKVNRVKSWYHEARFWVAQVGIVLAWLALCLVLKALGRNLGETV